MAEEQIIKLLEEIRDLQKSNNESYRQTLANQEQSIQMQKEARRRARWTLPVFLLFLLIVLWPRLMYLFR